MSGPKVVRVVTREELIAICHGQIARLDAALQGWLRDGQKTGELTSDDIEAAQKRRDAIASLLADSRFLELQKAVPQEIAFLKGDRQERQARAAAAAARARTEARREAEACSALLAALQRAGKGLPAELATVLEEAAAGRRPAGSALRVGFDLLATTTVDDQAAIENLAAKLRDGPPSRSLDDWRSQQPADRDELALSRIEARLSELALLSTPEEAKAFEDRAAALKAGEGGARRGLLLDSLALDLGRRLAEARTDAEARERFGEAVAELSTLDPAAAQVFVQEAQGLQTQALEALTSRALEETTSRREALAAEQRRLAVLAELASLGYEVTEGLSTSWVEDGRVVLRRPAQPGYGIEVAGGAKAGRFQMRVVAFGEGAADPSRDKDAETLWCGDVSKLQEKLAAAGGALTIEKAMPVGATAVKRVAIEEDRARSREGGRSTELKSLS